MDFWKLITLKTRTSYPAAASIFPHSVISVPFGSVTTREYPFVLVHSMMFGLMKKRVLPLPEPPMTSTFLFRAFLGFAGRLLMVRRSVWVRMMLFHGSGSTNGAMSLGFPQRAAPYSSPCRYFLAFLRFACTSRHSAHPHRNPISRSRGTKPDSPFRNAIATPSRRCRNFAEKSVPADSRHASLSFAAASPITP